MEFDWTVICYVILKLCAFLLKERKSDKKVRGGNLVSLRIDSFIFVSAQCLRHPHNNFIL